MPGLSTTRLPASAPLALEHMRPAQHNRDVVIDIDPPVTPLPTHASTHPNHLQSNFQATQKARLNATFKARLESTTHLQVSDEHLARFKEISTSLQQFDSAMRNEKAQQFLGEVFQMLGTDEKSVLAELRNEALTMQIPGVINAAIGLTPTLIGSQAKGIAAAGGTLSMAALGLAYQPLVGVLISNAFYSAFDMTRSAGMPGRSRQVESAKSLDQTAKALSTAIDALQQELDAASSVTLGTPEAVEVQQRLVEKSHVLRQAVAERERRDAVDTSYVKAQYFRTAVSMAKQVALWLSQIAVLANNDDCQGSKKMFQMQMAMTAILQLLQGFAAPFDRQREGRDIIATNLAHGKIETKDDVRDMIRMPMTQKMWLVNDDIEKRTTAKLGELAKETGIPGAALRKFEEAGGFDQPRYAAPFNDETQARWNDFKATCEGPPLANCRGALEELGKLVVLDEVDQLRMLERLGDPSSTAAPPGIDQIRATLGLASEAGWPALDGQYRCSVSCGALAAKRARLRDGARLAPACCRVA